MANGINIIEILLTLATLIIKKYTPMRYIYTLLLLLLAYTPARAVTAGFTADFTSGCAPLVVHFTNTSTGATSYSWDLGNGTSTPLTDASTSYLAVGTYTVTLTAYSGGTSSTHSVVITVYPSPTVVFTASDTTICPGTTIAFTNSSIAGVPGGMTYLWNFGDGSTSTAANPTHTYTTPGNYNVSLTVTNAQGCTRTYTRSSYVEVYPRPTVNFFGSPLAICNPPGTVTFANTSSGAMPLSYLWTFGGSGGTSTSASPSYTYTAPGSYDVKLVVTDGNGCKDSLIRYAYVNVSTNTASFTGPTTACPNTNVTFHNTSSTHTSRTWNFGDGAIDTNYDGSHMYIAPGTYTVTLTINNLGCTDTETHVITIFTPAPADFTLTPDSACEAPQTISYTATVSPGSTVLWIPEAGSTSTGLSGSHTFTTNGRKIITMVVTDANGCIDTIRHSAILFSMTFAGTAVPDRGCVPLHVDFSTNIYTWDPDSVLEYYPFPISSYVWAWGDGSASGSGATPSHTFTAPGIYQVTVTVTSANGCVGEDTLTILVGTPPVVTFTAAPTHICNGDTVDFTATVITGPVSQYEWFYGDGSNITLGPFSSHRYAVPGYYTVTLIPTYNGCEGPPYIWPVVITVDSPMARIDYTIPCGSITTVYFGDSSLGDDTHIWFFGDGTTSTADNPIHNYPSTGIYTVTLTTYNAHSGCRDTTTSVLSLFSPVLTITASDTAICLQDTVHFTSSMTGGSIISYQWWVDDTTKTWKTNPTLTDTFTWAGYHTIVLVVVDNRGCYDTALRTHWVVVGDPHAGFEPIPPSGCWALNVNFTDTTHDVPGVAMSSFYWDFGDGSTTTSTTITTPHLYTMTGSYSVMEIATDNIGCFDTAYYTPIIVRRPHAAFNATNDHPCAGSPTTFNNTSTGAVSSLWFFGDGGTSTAMTPTYTYTAVGTYTVKLVITDMYGCHDTATINAYINVTKPVAAFTMSDTFSVCLPLLDVFTNHSTGATSYTWDFGDGNTSVLTSPTNLYSIPNLYTVTLVAINPWGCKDTVSHTLNMYGYAGAFHYAPLQGCTPLTVNFGASISNVSSIIWDFGDGTTSVMSLVDTAVHTYTLPGAYVPKLILSDNTGCQNSSIGIDTIKVEKISAKLGVSPEACVGSDFNLVDSSTWYWSPVNAWFWNFNGDTSTLASPTHRMDTVGSYPVSLHVWNAWGCEDSVTGEIVVHPLPVITAGPDTTVCVGDPATLWGYGAVSYFWTGPAATLGCAGCNPTTATPFTESTYTVVGTDVHGCKDTTDLLLKIRTNTNAAAWGDSSMCFGMSVPLFDTGGTSYKWLPAGGLSDPTIWNPLASPGSTTTYMAIAQLAGCIPDTDYVTVKVFSLPNVNAGIDQEVLAGSLVQLHGSGTNIVTFEWSPSTDLSCFNCPSPEVTVNETTHFILTGTSQYGCRVSDTVDILVYCNSRQVFLPTVFTPNGDGENDVFYPRGAGIAIIKSFRIYNRWGELLFERSNIQPNDALNAWDGSYLGGPPKPDVYVYVVEATCSTGKPVLVKGDVTIVR